MANLVTAEEAINDCWDHGFGRNSKFICPNCRAFAQQDWGSPVSLSIHIGDGKFANRSIKDRNFVFSLCSACGAESAFRGLMLIYPESVDAPRPNDDMPADVREDFEEARQIASRSPRGAAALLRLAVQKLCPLIGADEDDINSMIGQLVAKGTVPATVQQALDSVRVIGNESVHPGTLDLKDDQATVRALFGLVNFIVEKAISDPKRIGEIYSILPPGKLAGINARDGSNPA